MKKISTLFTTYALLTLSIISYGQDKNKTFEYGVDGINDYVVVELVDVNKENLYDASMDWIEESYTHPDSVIILNNKNERIRLSGIGTNICVIRGKYVYDIHYIVDILFKDNKYKFEIVSLKTSAGGDLMNIVNFKTDKKHIRNFGETPKNIERHMNMLSNGIKEQIKAEGDDW